MMLRTALVASLLSCWTVLAGCADAVDTRDEALEEKPYDDEDDVRIGSLQQAVRYGDLSFPEDERTGAVRFWVWNWRYQEWRNTCSGTLIANNRVATARHCLEPTAESQADGYPMLTPWGGARWEAVISHGPTIANISGVSLAPDRKDGAVLRLVSNVPVMVGTTRTTSGWKRPFAPIYSNALYFVAAFGLTGLSAEPSSICRQGTKGCWYDRRPMSVMWNLASSHSNPAYVMLPYDPQTGRNIESGDSGSGMLLLGNATTISQLPLAGIFSASGGALVNGQLKSGGIALRTEDPATRAWLLSAQQ